jgi:putative DNA primase/helicase
VRAGLASIVRAVGGELFAGGRRASIPGPGHSPQDRSVSLLLIGRRVVVHSFAGDDWRDVLGDLRARGLVDAAGRLTGVGGSASPPASLPHPVRTAAALNLWDGAHALPGTLSQTHLALRGVAAPPEAELRHHPAVRAAVYAGRGSSCPALLAAIRDAGGRLCGVEVTYLAADGRRAALPVSRKVIGVRPPGAAVRLAPAGPRLLVGEGVVTCLSAAALFGLPAWALLSTSNLRAWRPPPGVKSVLIAADRGRDGERSARVLARGLRACGLSCRIRLPPPTHGDWNDAVAAGWRERKDEEWRARRTGGPDAAPEPQA